MATTNNKRFVRVTSIAQLFDVTNLQNFLEGKSWSFLETAANQGVTKDSVIFINQTATVDGTGMHPELFYAGAKLMIAQGVLYDTTSIDKQLLKGFNTELNIIDSSITAEDSALTAFGKLQGQVDALKQGISDVSVVINENDADYASTSKEEGVIVIDLSVGTLADASNGAKGLATIEDIYQVLTEDELVWAAALNALNVSINVVNTSVANHETRITSLEASIGSLGPDLTARVTNLEASVGDISTWVNTTKTWITNTNSSINIINTSVNTLESNVVTINTSVNTLESDVVTINASLSDVSARVKALEDTSYVNTIGASGNQWVKASVDNTTGDVAVSVGIADGVIVDSNNITGTMVDTSILTAKAVQDMINNTVTGAVDFLGVFGTAGQDINAVLVDVQDSAKGAKTEYGDFFKFGVDVSAGGVEHAYHAGDVFVYNLDTHTADQIKNPDNWTLVHGEPDTDTWRAVKVNGTQVLSGTVNGGVALDISAGDSIQVTGDGTTGAVVINVVDTSTSPWHNAANDWALL